MALAEWMKLDQDRTLGELHGPGSHGAGTNKGYIDLTAMGSVSNAATQSLVILQQIEVGTRFFGPSLGRTRKSSRGPSHYGGIIIHMNDKSRQRFREDNL